MLYPVIADPPLGIAPEGAAQLTFVEVIAVV